jgi:hypothetical protein
MSTLENAVKSYDTRVILHTLSLGGCVTIVKNTHHPIFVIPGLTRNPVSFQADAQLDAGSVILDSIQDRHDAQKISDLLHYGTTS